MRKRRLRNTVAARTRARNADNDQDDDDSGARPEEEYSLIVNKQQRGVHCAGRGRDGQGQST